MTSPAIMASNPTADSCRLNVVISEFRSSIRDLDRRYRCVVALVGKLVVVFVIVEVPQLTVRLDTFSWGSSHNSEFLG